VFHVHPQSHCHRSWRAGRHRHCGHRMRTSKSSRRRRWSVFERTSATTNG